MPLRRGSKTSLSWCGPDVAGCLDGPAHEIDARIAQFQPGLKLNVGQSIKITDPLPFPGQPVPYGPPTPNYAGAANAEEPLPTPVMNFGQQPQPVANDDGPLLPPVMNFDRGPQAAAGGHGAPMGHGPAPNQNNTPGGQGGGEEPLLPPVWPG